MRPKQARRKLPKTLKIIGMILGLLIWAGAAVIVAQLIIGNIMLLIWGREVLNSPAMMALYSALSYILAVLLTVVVKKGELGLRGWPKWSDIGLAPIGYVVYLFLATGLITVFSIFPWFNATEAQELGFNTFMTGEERLFAFFTLVVAAPIAEEIIFRGWLYGKLRKLLRGNLPEWTGMLIAIFLVSLLFGIVHLQWNVGVNVFALSVVLCGLREVTGTIYSGILLHMLKNGIAFYLLYVLGVG